MPDDIDNIRQFQSRAVREQAREMLGRLQLDAPPLVEVAASRPQKMGLYPFAEDILVSRPLYALIISKLRTGTVEERQRVADLMDFFLDAPYAP